MQHRFKVHQMVRLARARFVDSRADPNELYEIIRLMPTEDMGEASYRIRSAGAGERAVRESEILDLEDVPV